MSISRSKIAFLHDVVMAAVSFQLSLWLRLGHAMPHAWTWDRLVWATGLFVLVACGVFWSQKMYRGIWRYASTSDLMALVKSVSLIVLIFLPVLFLVNRLEDFPRSALLINWFALLALLGGPRFLYRIAIDHYRGQDSGTGVVAVDARRVPVLLVGAGDEADLFLRATKRPDAGYRAVGMLTGKTRRVGLVMHGVAVLGLLDELPQVVEDLKKKGQMPERLIVTSPEFQGATLRHLLDQADALGISLARLPKLTDLKSGLSDKIEVRPIDVEDLLGRPQAVLDRSAMAGLIAGRRVLITGAGGSIGSELVRQISDCAPASVTLVESCEFALYSIDMEISRRHPDLVRHAVIADVRDAGRIDRVMADHKPELVFHAAALKHVPLVELNPAEGTLTNAVGTRIVADACRAHGVRMMLLISTDKAVNPTNVMGAAKRMAETYAQALDMAQGAGGTRYVTVRFGNVLGSTGSVVPLFQKQLAMGGPITVTHPDMTRYFMTIREAVELVLQAAALGVGNAAYQGRIFVLDMGEPVKIVHLARQMIRLAGLRPDQDIKIEFTGLRPGEKLYEEIFHGAEAPVPTECEGILVAAVRAVDLPWVAGQLDQLETACRACDLPGVMQVLHTLVPEYQAGA